MGKAGVTWLATGSPQGWCCSQGWPRGTTAHRQCPSPLYLQGRHSAFRLSTEESKDSRDRTSPPQTPVRDGRLETTVTTGCVCQPHSPIVPRDSVSPTSVSVWELGLTDSPLPFQG